ncbi:hypothetical protein [Burkholderia ubonensis]|uniref:hypothetical protein n=1 Tax=Burkholderia ubonensis TaxID=101571 RepID=UPI000758CDDE|nr:hypothetical protein [Burkholderia ubonensis]KVP77451.1 hypothetical protein WJ93_04820 [Burkholderia ubonensis]KVX98764.1 hypothetical protein WL11_24250 [Burkholderia ubonensis]KWN74817.1 hypothetical protein WM23_27720 [Burkholderia ubonensis]
MNHFRYRAYYDYAGPSKSAPFRNELTVEKIEDALSSFPQHLDHYLDTDAVVQAGEYRSGTRERMFTVVTAGDRTATSEAVARCLSSFDLYGEPMHN